MSDRPTCAVCESMLSVTWTDTHGVGACIVCALPYRIYHYDGDQRVDKAPSLAVDDKWLPLAREYWTENRRRVFPACYDMGFLGSRGRTYSGASEEDILLFNEWMNARKGRWPAQEPGSPVSAL
jgi:hypothetical protein